MLTPQQESDFKWYKGELADLYREYGECHAIISDRKVVGTYPTFGMACRDADARGLEPGTYIVQEIGPNEDAYTDSFAGMWVVA